MFELFAFVYILRHELKQGFLCHPEETTKIPVAISSTAIFFMRQLASYTSSRNCQTTNVYALKYISFQFFIYLLKNSRVN